MRTCLHHTISLPQTTSPPSFDRLQQNSSCAPSLSTSARTEIQSPLVPKKSSASPYRNRVIHPLAPRTPRVQCPLVAQLAEPFALSHRHPWRALAVSFWTCVSISLCAHCCDLRRVLVHRVGLCAPSDAHAQSCSPNSMRCSSFDSDFCVLGRCCFF